MFGLGMGELLIIAVVALLVLGPDKLPEAAKSLSKGIRDFRKHSRDLQRTIEDDDQIGGAIRDLKSALRGEEVYVPPHLNREALDDDEDDDDPADPSDETGGSDSDDDHGPEGPSVDTESAADTQGLESTSDDELPVLRPASGTVSKGDVDELEPTPATAKAADDAHG